MRSSERVGAVAEDAVGALGSPCGVKAVDFEDGSGEHVLESGTPRSRVGGNDGFDVVERGTSNEDHAHLIGAKPLRLESAG
ncbi:MAG: hypothetical protein P8L16_00065 [Ilumatobacter sp.]|nr:hypothetical protein [Ilumatobacter sp.]